MKAKYHQYILQFKQPSGTSRGILHTKETWFIIISDGDKEGIGECGLLRALSIDDRPDYEEKLKWVCENIHWGSERLWDALIEFPSIQFGVEMAFRSLYSDSKFLLFPSEFTKGKDVISINGLVWMGDVAFMKQQIEDKIHQGFRCVKIKIGAIDFQSELDILSEIRARFTEDQIEIRVDANGAFSIDEVEKKLKNLSQYKLHSIEQPIRPRNQKKMAELCKNTPIPIALDEELIGVFDIFEKEKLLQTIKPHYIILKPSLVGGFKGTKEWIDLAESNNIGWWVTSALESNIGLNAIAQYTYTLSCDMHQGLGTGGLYINNFDSPLEILGGSLQYNTKNKWIVDAINKK